MKTKDYWVVVIEWDGLNAPSSWYEWMHKLAGRVRGDWKEPPLTRREDKGIIFQEGVILCPTESLARQLALLARDNFGAVAVAYGECTLALDFMPRREDQQVLQRLKNTIGKRGPKPKPQDYVVTCLEELKLFAVNTTEPYNCPHCHGLKIRQRTGFPVKWRDDGRPIFDLWLATRFWGAHWEPCELTDEERFSAPPKIEVADLGNERDQLFAATTAFSQLVSDLEKFDRQAALEIIDAAYVNRVHVTQDRRNEQRMRVITKFFQLGGSPIQVSLAETPEADWFDAAALLPENEYIMKSALRTYGKVT